MVRITQTTPSTLQVSVLRGLGQASEDRPDPAGRFGRDGHSELRPEQPERPDLLQRPALRGRLELQQPHLLPPPHGLRRGQRQLGAAQAQC